MHAEASPDLASPLGDADLTVPALLDARAEISPEVPALWSRSEASSWQSMNWRAFRDAVARAARGLRASGLKPGDRVGIIAPSCASWDVAQIAAMAAGGVVVGLDPHDTNARLHQIADQCDLAAVIAHDEALLARVGSRADGGRRIDVTLEPTRVAGLACLADLAAKEAGESDADWNRAEAADDALIVFTSGTTGEPRGITYTHRQVCGAVAAILQAFPDIAPGSRLACWLPLSNLFQRMINLCAIGRGAQTFYVEDPRSIMQHVGAISPHLFIGVPRFYEKLYEGIRSSIDAAPGWKKALAQWAIRAGDRRARAAREGTRSGAIDALSAALAERLALRRIRSVMGENLRYMVSGSAPMPTWLLERFHGLGLLVLEAYGMSESIVPVAANRPGRYLFGTVGQALDTSEVGLAADGELLLRGPGVFSGYLGETDGCLDPDGFLATGDYASIDSDGFITLLGRKSDLFKTSTGRRIAPAIIESHLRQIPYVEHAVVFGASRPFPVAVLAVSGDELRSRVKDHSATTDLETMSAVVRAGVASAVADLSDYQRPAGVVVTATPFTVAGGQITPNLKVRRTQVEASFAGELSMLFDAIAQARGEPVAIARDGGTLLIST